MVEICHFGQQMYFMAVKKERKYSCFANYSYFKERAFAAVKRNPTFFNKGCERGTITALFTNMRTLKFKSRLHNCVFRCRQS